MASSPIDRPQSLEAPGGAVDRFRETLLAPVSAVAFWAAIALPFLHLPLLLTTGLSSPSTAAAFVALLALNVVALLLGHPYARE